MSEKKKERKRDSIDRKNIPGGMTFETIFITTLWDIVEDVEWGKRRRRDKKGINVCTTIPLVTHTCF